MNKFLIFTVFWCHISSAFFGSSLTRTIDSLIHKTNPHLMVGIEIRSLPSGKIVYQKNPHVLAQPASLQKIPAGLVAYLKLGPDYRFETTVFEKEGSIYLKFSGDPTLTLSDLEKLFRSYKEKKGRIIRGDIIINEESVPTFPHGSGWTVESTRFLYGAPILVQTINKNSVCFRVVPGKTEKDRTTTIYDPDQPSYRINNKSISAICSDDAYMERCDLDLEKGISIKGCIPYGSAAFKVCLPIKEHRFKEYVRKCIQSCLKRAGMHLNGKILFRSFSQEKKKFISSHRSESLSIMLQTGLKNSDNMIMESLFIPFMLKNPERFRKNKEIHRFISESLQEELGVNFSCSSLTDGSGLSRHNLISPHHLGDLMERALQHKELGEKWLTLMAVGGKDGTLEQRLKTLPKGITVLAKTGTLTGVSNLAGYILKDKKPQYLFVIMVQNFIEKEKAYEALQDKIVIHLSQLVE